MKVTLDLGTADVSQPAPISGSKKRFPMATISTKKRDDLPGSKFALPAERKFPIHDAAHVRNAAARLEQQKGSMDPAKYKTARSAIARAAKRFGVESSFNESDRPQRRLHVRADLAEGGSLHVRHMADLGGVVALDGVPIAMADATEKPVWIELAKPGVFKGHPSGPFELNDQTFREIIRNFERTQNRAIPIDFEHASESEATDGSIPVTGAPAQGWIKQLKVEAGRLKGLVEWGKRAREMILEGQYKFFSPAIRFNTKDRVSGEPTGAKMTSGALTNIPFLDGLKPLAAKDGGELVQAVWDGDLVELKGALAHSSAEYMPSIKACLKLPELATAAECSDHLARLRAHLEAAGGDHEAAPQGVQLGDYLKPMRAFVGATPGDTWDQVLDLVQDLIDAAMDEHEIRYHGAPPEDAEMSEDEEDATMATLNGRETTDMSLEAKIADLTTQNAEQKTALAEQKTALKETGEKLGSAEVKLKETTDKLAEVSVALKAETARADSAETELKTLRDWKDGEEKRQFDARLSEAFDTYKDERKLNDVDKEMMSVFLKANPAKFDERFPRISADKKHLLRNLTGNDRPTTPTNQVAENDGGGAAPVVNLADAALALSRQRGIPLDQAQRVIYAQFGGRLRQKDLDDRSAATRKQAPARR